LGLLFLFLVCGVLVFGRVLVRLSFRLGVGWGSLVCLMFSVVLRGVCWGFFGGVMVVLGFGGAVLSFFLGAFGVCWGGEG